MQTLTLSATDSSLVLTSPAAVMVSGSSGTHEVVFSYSSAWDDLAVTAVFKCGTSTIVTVPLTDKDAPCTVPWEVMATPHCSVYVGIFGVDENATVVIPTICARICPLVQDGADIGCTTSQDPTDTVYAQWVAQVQADTLLAKSYAQHPPTSGSNDNWWVWDGTEYIDSGVPLGVDVDAKVNAAVSALVDSAPEALDTLNELATALGDDPNFATTVATQIATKASQEDMTAAGQSIINLSASVALINTDLVGVAGELDEVNEQIEGLNEDIIEAEYDIEQNELAIIEVVANMEMYRQKVVRDGAATFAAADNTDYQWSTAQSALAVTLPAVTDFTRTHIINLNFIAGSSAPLSLFGDYNTPVDWEFVQGCMYQIEFKYIETAWEIRQYCPEKEYASADDLDDKVSVPTLTASGLTDVVIASLGDNEVHGYMGISSGGSGVTSLTITEIDQTDTGAESVILIETGDTFTFTPPSNMRSIGEITFEANTEYVIVIRAGICVIGKLNEV